MTDTPSSAARGDERCPSCECERDHVHPGRSIGPGFAWAPCRDPWHDAVPSRGPAGTTGEVAPSATKGSADPGWTALQRASEASSLRFLGREPDLYDNEKVTATPPESNPPPPAREPESEGEPIEVTILRLYGAWADSDHGRSMLSKPLSHMEAFGAGYRAALASRPAAARETGEAVAWVRISKSHGNVLTDAEERPLIYVVGHDDSDIRDELAFDAKHGNKADSLMAPLYAAPPHATAAKRNDVEGFIVLDADNVRRSVVLFTARSTAEAVAEERNGRVVALVRADATPPRAAGERSES